jgi:hypothetical protein
MDTDHFEPGARLIPALHDPGGDSSPRAAHMMGRKGPKGTTETLGVLSEMSQDARSYDGPVVLTFRAWNPLVEPWDDFIGALKRAFALYLDDYRRPMTAKQTGHDPEPDVLDPDGDAP